MSALHAKCMTGWPDRFKCCVARLLHLVEHVFDMMAPIFMKRQCSVLDIMSPVARRCLSEARPMSALHGYQLPISRCVSGRAYCRLRHHQRLRAEGRAALTAIGSGWAILEVGTKLFDLTVFYAHRCGTWRCSCLATSDEGPADPKLDDAGFGPGGEDEPGAVLMRGKSCMVSLLGEVLAGPDCSGETILTAERDQCEIARGKYDFDAVAHYARPDDFRLHFNERPMPAVVVSEARMNDLFAESKK